MTTTRPLAPRYKAILTALEGGPLLARELVAAGIVKPMSHLPALLDAGFVCRSESADVRATWSYSVTVEGRAVLESGVVPQRVHGQGWNAGTPLRPKLVLAPGRCVHYWKIGNDVGSTGVCQKCKATKEFRSPFLVLGKAPTRTERAFGDDKDSDYGNERDGGSGAYVARGAGSSETLPSTAEAG